MKPSKLLQPSQMFASASFIANFSKLHEYLYSYSLSLCVNFEPIEQNLNGTFANKYGKTQC